MGVKHGALTTGVIRHITVVIQPRREVILIPGHRALAEFIEATTEIDIAELPLRNTAADVFNPNHEVRVWERIGELERDAATGLDVNP